MAITPVQISTNRYAPEGSNAVNLYRTTLDTTETLTFGQLLVAVNLQAAAICEARAVTYMNRTSANSASLQLMQYVANRLTNEDTITWGTLLDKSQFPSNYTCQSQTFANNPTVWNYFVEELKIDSKILPNKLADGDDEGFNRRLQAFSALKDKMDEGSRVNQKLQIGLQTQVSRRDVAYSTSSNLLKNLLASMMTGAQVLRGDR